MPRLDKRYELINSLLRMTDAQIAMFDFNTGDVPANVWIADTTNLPITATLAPATLGAVVYIKNAGVGPGAGAVTVVADAGTPENIDATLAQVVLAPGESVLFFGFPVFFGSGNAYWWQIASFEESALSIKPVITLVAAQLPYLASYRELVQIINTTGDATLGAQLPKAAFGPGQEIVVKNDPTSTGGITVYPDPTLPDTIDGLASSVIAVGDSLRFISDGISNWVVT